MTVLVYSSESSIYGTVLKFHNNKLTLFARSKKERNKHYNKNKYEIRTLPEERGAREVHKPD